jgi:hypothetical protein
MSQIKGTKWEDVIFPDRDYNKSFERFLKKYNKNKENKK